MTLALILIWLVALAAVVILVALSESALPALNAMLLVLPSAVAMTLVVVVRRQHRSVQTRLDEALSTLGDLRREMANLRRGDAGLSPVAHSRIEALAAAQEQTDTRLTLFFSRRGRDRTPPAAPADGQEPRLALDDGQSPDDAPIQAADLIRALHFPEDENDTEGFDALRKCLADSRTAGLIRAAQDVLTHLSQEGIYMDDLRPDRARPEFWRAFAQGTRGTLIAPLGGIRDRSCLALTAARMRNTPDFKTAAHMFLREFDRVFALFEKDADDAQIAALAETRSARAFMLLGRVSGVFSR